MPCVNANRIQETVNTKSAGRSNDLAFIVFVHLVFFVGKVPPSPYIPTLLLLLPTPTPQSVPWSGVTAWRKLLHPPGHGLVHLTRVHSLAQWENGPMSGRYHST